MLDKVKLALRINSTKLDTEIQDLIDACLIDLSISGVRNRVETDPIIIRAVILYCKAQFGLSNADSEKYQNSYDLLKMSLKLCGDYNVIQP